MSKNTQVLTGDWDTASMSRNDAQFLSKVNNLVPSMIYVFNQTSQSIEYSNHSLEEALGYSAQEIAEMGANLMPALCHPDDLDRLYTHFEKISGLADGELIDLEFRVRHIQGHWIWLLSRETVFERGPSGSVTHHLGIASDITLQKMAEEKALEETARAQATNNELRAFAYAMSHDIKAPTNTLKLLLGEIQKASHVSGEGAPQELIEMGLDTVERMGELVDDVLHYTTVIGQPLELQRIDLKELIASILRSVHGDICRTNAKIDVGPLPEVLGSELQLRLLFQNLIENGLKFRFEESSPLIAITASKCDHLGKTDITVRDNGIGIALEQHEQVFATFKRLNPAQSFGGSGLGLAICWRIARNHGSDIALESRLGAGAAFTVQLQIP